MRFQTFSTALLISAAAARSLPDITCAANDDFYHYKYPRSLKWAFASLHEGFGDDTTSQITMGNVEAIIDGLHENARFNGISMPMFPDTGAEEYSEAYNKVWSYARQCQFGPGGDEQMMFHASPMYGSDPRASFANDTDYLAWISQFIYKYAPEVVSPFSHVDMDQHEHVELLADLLEGSAAAIHALGPLTPDQWATAYNGGGGGDGTDPWACASTADPPADGNRRRDLQDIAPQGLNDITDEKMGLINRFQITLFWQTVVDDPTGAPPTFSVYSDFADATLPNKQQWLPACSDADRNSANCVSSFVGDGTTNLYNDGTNDWWYWTLFPTTLDGIWSEGDQWCFYIEQTKYQSQASVDSATEVCSTVPQNAIGEKNFPNTLILGPEFWMPMDYDFETSDIDHNGMHGTYEYLTQEERIEEAILAGGDPWDFVDFTEHYEAFSAINFPGDNKAKREDWNKLVEYQYETTGEYNTVFNAMTAAEWNVKPFDHSHEPFESLDDTWVAPTRRQLNSLYVEDDVGQGLCDGDEDCLRMPSVTESIDGGVCGLVVWRAYPRMVDDEGNITNRAFMWLEGGFADDSDGSYRLRNGRGCGKALGHYKRDLKAPSNDQGAAHAYGHTKNGDFKGHCPFDNKTGRYDLSARSSREEAPCGESVEQISLESYQPCATSLDNAAYRPPVEEEEDAADDSARLLAKKEEEYNWGGVTITPEFDYEIDAKIEECDNESGECVTYDVVSGDSYTFNFDDSVSYNFIGQNTYSTTNNINLHYAWFEAGAKAGLAASLVAGTTLLALF